MTDPCSSPPNTRAEIEKFLREAGYDPVLLHRTMEEFATRIIERERMKRLDAWLDTFADEPLTPDEVDAIVAYVKREMTP